MTAPDRLRSVPPRYDMIVIGGGIHGVALAWEATLRGLSVALLEREDFASGASANSLKVIHGGLRYLQQLDVGRVLESARERRILMRIAPHLVAPLACQIPTSPSLLRGQWALGAGCLLYNLLTIGRNRQMAAEQHIPAARLLSASALRTTFPALRLPPDLTGGARWHDAQAHHPERLVLAFALAASQRGATLLNHAEVRDFMIQDQRIRGVVVYDHLTATQASLYADLVVDCSSGWALSQRLLNAAPPAAHAPAFVKAANLVVNRPLASQAIGLQVPSGDRRLLFIAPWRRQSLIGTWYFPGSPHETPLALQPHELQHCLQQTSSLLQTPLTEPEISHVHLGWLPGSPSRLAQGGDPAAALWRAPDLTHASDWGGPQGLFLLQGVKLTTGRAVAVHALNRIARTLRLKLPPSHSHRTPLYGGDMRSMARFTQHCLEHYGHMLTPVTIQRLVAQYGTCCLSILERALKHPACARPLPGAEHVIQGELDFILRHELAWTLPDLLLRRLDLGDQGCPAPETIDFCAQWMARWRRWSPAMQESQRTQLRRFYENRSLAALQPPAYTGST